MQHLLVIQGGTSLKHYLSLLSTCFNVMTFFILMNFLNTLSGLLFKRDTYLVLGLICQSIAAALEFRNQINLVQAVQSIVVSDNLLCASKQNISCSYRNCLTLIG